GGGEGGIRTHGTLRYTRFPGVPDRPLQHLSERQTKRYRTSPGRYAALVAPVFGLLVEPFPAFVHGFAGAFAAGFEHVARGIADAEGDGFRPADDGVIGELFFERAAFVFERLVECFEGV